VQRLKAVKCVNHQNLHKVQQLCVDADILEISSEHIIVPTLTANEEHAITDIWFHDVNAAPETT